MHTEYTTTEFKADVADPFSQQFLWRVDNRVTLDNGLAQTVSLKGRGIQQVVYNATDVPAADHTLTLVCQGSGRINVDAFKVMDGCIQVDGFTVDAIDFDAINLPDEPVQDPEDMKPKSKIDKIRHLEVPSSPKNPVQDDATRK